MTLFSSSEVSAGLAAGAPPYGYTTEEAPGGRRLVVDPAQAAIVTRIFNTYLAGAGFRESAHQLNHDAHPAAAPARPPGLLVPERHPRDAAEPRLPGRPGLEPLRVGEGPRHRAPTSP